MLGGAVQGGQIYGTFPTFELGGPDDTDIRGRWIPSTAIDQYGATLCSWFGIPDSALPTIFPNFSNFGSRKLGFLGWPAGLERNSSHISNLQQRPLGMLGNNRIF